MPADGGALLAPCEVDGLLVGGLLGGCEVGRFLGRSLATLDGGLDLGLVVGYGGVAIDGLEDGIDVVVYLLGGAEAPEAVCVGCDDSACAGGGGRTVSATGIVVTTLAVGGAARAAAGGAGCLGHSVCVCVLVLSVWIVVLCKDDAMLC